MNAEASMTGSPDPGGCLRPGCAVLVTGAAGFVGSHLSERLVRAGHRVIGVDCFTDFYARELKLANLVRLFGEPSFRFVELNLGDGDLRPLLSEVEVVFHLAAQAGVRGSFGDTFGRYLHDNLMATQRLLEAAVQHPVRSFVFASSSSVYGNAATHPTNEDTPRRPVSPYGMTKVGTEDLAGTYHRCFGIPVVGLRYFTVYGPRQRPDMAFTRFMHAILDGEPLTVFGDGSQVRDFTYVDDAVGATIAAAQHGHPGAVYNIGGGREVQLVAAIRSIERLAGRTACLEFAPRQVGDARRTGCDGRLARRDLGFAAQTNLEDGLAAQLEWLLSLRRAAALDIAA